MIRAFYDGNQYLLFVTENFKDVRLVVLHQVQLENLVQILITGFGPRHTGDFLYLEFMPTKTIVQLNIQKTTFHTNQNTFPCFAKGIQENDFTMVMGYPGRTQEYLPSFAVEQIVNDLNPAKIEIRDAALKVQDGFMRKDNAIKIQYALKICWCCELLEKWIGETKGLKKSECSCYQKRFLKRNFKKELTKQENKLNTELF